METRLIKAQNLKAGDVVVGPFDAKATVTESRTGQRFVHVTFDTLPKVRYEIDNEVWIEVDAITEERAPGKVVAVAQHKGGVGASTVRAALALVAATEGLKVLIAGDPDAAAIFGLASEPNPGEPVTLESVTISMADPTNDDAYILGGARHEFDLIITEGWCDGADHSIIVARGCYLNLRHSVRDERTARADGFVLVEEPGRSLGVNDVANVLGAPCLAAVPVRASIARAIDAGVFPTRLPNEIARPAREVLRRLGVIERRSESADA